MAVKAEKAIYFECEKCGHGQFIEYTLEHGWLFDYENDDSDRAVMRDSIICEKCKHGNEVYEEL